MFSDVDCPLNFSKLEKSANQSLWEFSVLVAVGRLVCVANCLCMRVLPQIRLCMVYENLFKFWRAPCPWHQVIFPNMYKIQISLIEEGVSVGGYKIDPVFKYAYLHVPCSNALSGLRCIKNQIICCVYNALTLCFSSNSNKEEGCVFLVFICLRFSWYALRHPSCATRFVAHLSSMRQSMCCTFLFHWLYLDSSVCFATFETMLCLLWRCILVLCNATDFYSEVH